MTVPIAGNKHDRVSRLRDALAGTTGVTERKRFGNAGFMVHGKFSLSACAERIMCRIVPALHDKAVARAGFKTVVIRGRSIKGCMHVAADVLTTRRALDYWVRMALAYKQTLEPAKRRG